MNNRRQKIVRGLLYLALMLALILLAFDRTAAYLYRPNAHSTEVAIYTTTWCGYCRALREHLRKNQIPFVERDVEMSLAGSLGFWTLRGRGVPVSVIGPEVIYGFRSERIDAALTHLGYSIADRIPTEPMPTAVTD